MAVISDSTIIEELPFFNMFTVLLIRQAIQK